MEVTPARDRGAVAVAGACGLVDLLREGRISPAVPKRPPLDGVRCAPELLFISASSGKLVLVP